MNTDNARARLLLFTVFTISGFSGLIYESIWSHYLKLFLGHAAYAQTLVLAIFMGGMALGSWFIARRGQRWRNLLLAYVAVEGVIGVFGLFFHKGFLAATAFFFSDLVPVLDSPDQIALVKWGLASLLILPQSILLGMTFPLMSGGILRRFPDRPGATLSLLYFTNSLGAAIGVLVSGFALIPAVGLPGTILTAGLLNIFLALFVWFLVRLALPEPAIASEETDRRTVRGGLLTPLARWILLAAFFSGVAAFLYEIAWIRMLSLVLGSSTHAFELMLSAFILGLALGGLWISRWADGLPDPRRFLGRMMILMGSLAAGTLWLYDQSFDWMAETLRALSDTEPGYVAFNLVSHLIAGAIMLPTTLCAGMTLPLMTQVLLKTPYGERAIGGVYAVNTLGAILGVMGAIHLLMPLVGVKGILLVGVALHLVAGLGFLWPPRDAGDRRRPTAALAWSLALLLVFSLGVHLDPRKMAATVFRTGHAEIPPSSKILYHRDGKTATVSLLERKDGIVGILTNGKPDASINMRGGKPSVDEATMALAGSLPVLLHPHPAQVANIGIGSGLTSHVLLATDRVARLDTVEIEPLMAEAARRGFGSRVRNLFEDPRSHIHFEDAKSFFASHRGRYDIIVSEPSNPWVSGVATLFSDEFYQRIRADLAPNGLFVQWIQMYETDLSVVASIMKALSRHFSDYLIYNTNDVDMLVIATPEGTLPPLDEDPFDQPALAAELTRAGLRSRADLTGRYLGTKALLDPLFRSFPVPMNSDYFPFVDYRSPKMRFLNRNAGAFTTIRRTEPVPLVEMLGGQRTASAPAALRIRDALLQGDLRKVPLPLRRDWALLDLDAHRCADASLRRGLWLNAVYSLFRETTPQLTPEDAAPLWKRIRKTPCDAQLQDAERRPLALWEAAARWDGPGMIAAGQGILSQGAVLSQPDQYRLVIALTMLGYLSQGQPAAAQAIWTRFGHRAPESHSHALILRWLRALSTEMAGE